jgi:genome maintenance exonuclease 1
MQTFKQINCGFDFGNITESKQRGKRHYVTPEGKIYPSVTTFLSLTAPAEKTEGLDKWRQRIGNDEADRQVAQSQNIGKAAHTIIEDALGNKSSDMRGFQLGSEDLLMANQVASGIIKTIQPNLNGVIKQEIGLYSDNLRLAGRCDLFAIWKNKFAVIDFKNKRKAVPEDRPEWIQSYFDQCLIYSIMLEEKIKQPVRQIVIPIGVWTGETQIFERKITDELRQDITDQINAFHKNYGT